MLPGCGADLDLLTRRVLIRTPAQRVVIGFFDRAGDFGPEILTLNPRAFTGCGLAAKFGIVDEQVEHALKICRVTAVDGEAGAVDHFINFTEYRWSARRHRPHGIEKGQRQALKLRPKHEQSGIGVALYAMSHGEHRPAEWMPSSIA